MRSIKNDEGLSLEGKRVVLLLQGGGALGAYQVGAYKALNQACKDAQNKIAWVGGISIGAVNAAVIAGPKRGDASRELEELWDEILSPEFLPFDCNVLWPFTPSPFHWSWLAPLVPKYWNFIGEAWAGQLNFFASRFGRPWVFQWLGPLTADEAANYSTSPLHDTLNRHVDWKAINEPGGTWLSLGATRVTDGEVEFFNSFPSEKWGTKRVITTEHVMASAALPPAFPPVTINGETYWDGGVSSNTPIEGLAQDLTREEENTIVFLIDLWDRKGAVPRSMDEVMWRQKSIQFGSRKEAAVSVVDKYQLLMERQELMVEARRAQPVPPASLEVCQVMFECPPDDQDPPFWYSDTDFSRSTFRDMHRQGEKDMGHALHHGKRVPGVGGEHAALYRHGSFHKHVQTDQKYAEARKREEHKPPTKRAA